MSQPDPYEILGVGADATGADIVRAYRRLARGVHPDSRPADPSAAERFMAVSDAYRLLSDPARRAAYDHEHRARHARRPASPGTSAASGPALWPFPSITAPWDTTGPASGAALRAGPVRIEPPGIPDPPGSSQAYLSGSSASLAWLAYWLLAEPRERPW